MTLQKNTDIWSDFRSKGSSKNVTGSGNIWVTEKWDADEWGADGWGDAERNDEKGDAGWGDDEWQDGGWQDGGWQDGGWQDDGWQDDGLHHKKDNAKLRKYPKNQRLSTDSVRDSKVVKNKPAGKLQIVYWMDEEKSSCAKSPSENLKENNYDNLDWNSAPRVSSARVNSCKKGPGWESSSRKVSRGGEKNYERSKLPETKKTAEKSTNTARLVKDRPDSLSHSTQDGMQKDKGNPKSSTSANIIEMEFDWNPECRKRKRPKFVW